VNLKLDNSGRRIAFAIATSLLLHGLAMWGPDIRLPKFNSLRPLTARLEALPTDAPTKPKPKNRIKHAVPTPPPESAPQAETPPEMPLAASEPVAASAPAETPTLATVDPKAVERPPLPKRAELTFSILKGIDGFRIGEAIHTLEIENGRYLLHSVTKTVGLARLFKSFELNQFSSGSYSKFGLQPEQFMEERKESSGTLRSTATFNRTELFADISPDSEVALPPDTQDILSILYQFPPLQGAELATVSVCNGKKIEQYEFEIFPDEEIDTALGKLLTVRLSKLHRPNEEGLEIWLAREYRLFPVKMRFYERSGEVAGEAVITDIRVSEEEGVRSDAVN
jgi:hypothetical protein